MKIHKTSERNNKLIGRKELMFFIDHNSKGTPFLLEVKKAIASMYGVNDNLVYVIKLQTLAGTNRTRGEAEIYEKFERARLLSPKHIQLKNLSENSDKKK